MSNCDSGTSKGILVAVAAAVISGLCVQPAEATIVKQAAAKTVSMNHDENGTCSVEVKGHISYDKSPYQMPGAPAGTYYYNFPSHHSGMCGDSYCTVSMNVVSYASYKVVSGLGGESDTRDVSLWEEQRVYRDSIETASTSSWHFTLFYDGDQRRSTTLKPAAFVTERVVQYKISASADSTWTEITATAGF